MQRGREFVGARREERSVTPSAWPAAVLPARGIERPRLRIFESNERWNWVTKTEMERLRAACQAGRPVRRRHWRLGGVFDPGRRSTFAQRFH
jgi:hypothetical protein